MEENLKVGDVVHLKSGSPRMTVIAIENDQAGVVYLPYGMNQLQYGKLPLAALEKKIRDV